MRARYVGRPEENINIKGLEGEAAYSPHFHDLRSIEYGAMYFTPDVPTEPDHAEPVSYYVAERDLKFLDS